MDAFTTALNLLSRRELSVAQLRTRLARRKFESEEIEHAVERLVRNRMLDDRRVAIAAARLEGPIRRRGRRRVLQKVRQLGISPALAKAAVEEVFSEVDEQELLDQAIERKLKGASAHTLDRKGLARIVRGLVGQGFEPGQVYARLKVRRPG